MRWPWQLANPSRAELAALFQQPTRTPASYPSMKGTGNGHYEPDRERIETATSQGVSRAGEGEDLHPPLRFAGLDQIFGELDGACDDIQNLLGALHFDHNNFFLIFSVFTCGTGSQTALVCTAVRKLTQSGSTYTQHDDKLFIDPQTLASSP